MIAAIFRYFSYLYNLVIAAAMLAVGLIAKFSGLEPKLEMLPWTGPALTSWLIGLGLAGLIIVGFAMFGVVRWPLLVWSLLILGLWLRAIYAPGWSFDGPPQFHQAIEGLAACMVSVIGALSAARLK